MPIIFPFLIQTTLVDLAMQFFLITFIHAEIYYKVTINCKSSVDLLNKPKVISSNPNANMDIHRQVKKSMKGLFRCTIWIDLLLYEVSLSVNISIESMLNYKNIQNLPFITNGLSLWFKKFWSLIKSCGMPESWIWSLDQYILYYIIVL